MARTGRGVVRMADVGSKEPTAREAVAEGRVLLSRQVWERVRRGTVPKGDVLAVAKVAGIVAAKETPRILPLCHPLPLSSVRVEISLPAPGRVRVEAEVRTVGPTGVEMEALCAVAGAALCLYDMLKPLTRAIRIDGIRLLRKTGGKSGDYLAPGRAPARSSSRASRAASRPSSGGSPRAPNRSRK